MRDPALHRGPTLLRTASKARKLFERAFGGDRAVLRPSQSLPVLFEPPAKWLEPGVGVEEATGGGSVNVGVGKVALSNAAVPPATDQTTHVLEQAATQLRIGDAVGCIEACIAIQRLALAAGTGLHGVGSDALDERCHVALLQATRGLLTVTPSTYLCSNDALYALQLLGSGKGRSAAKRVLLRVGAQTVLSAHLSEEIQSGGAPAAAETKHISDAGVESIKIDRIYHCIAALLNLCIENEALKDGLARSAAMVGAAVSLLKVEHSPCRRAAVALLTSLAVGAGSRNRRLLLVGGGVIEPLRDIADGSGKAVEQEQRLAASRLLQNLD